MEMILKMGVVLGIKPSQVWVFLVLFLFFSDAHLIPGLVPDPYWKVEN